MAKDNLHIITSLNRVLAYPVHEVKIETKLSLISECHAGDVNSLKLFFLGKCSVIFAHCSGDFFHKAKNICYEIFTK